MAMPPPFVKGHSKRASTVIVENNTEIGPVLQLDENLTLTTAIEGDVDPFYTLVSQEWARADADGSGFLDLKEITRVLSRLNVSIKKKGIKKRFDEVDVDKSGTLNFTEFMSFLNELRNRPEINMIFAMYSSGSDSMQPADFLRFLHESQMELAATTATALGIIRKCERSQAATRMYLSGFSAYMTSTELNGWRDRLHVGVYQNMSLPLCNYFISSSHNTYCTGDQLTGSSSVDSYVKALARGCRCVELDTWDGPNGEPLIYHGRTLTSRIQFRAVIEAIRDHAFDVSDYPVILSLENHCGVEQQRVMAEIMTTVLGDLMAPPVEDFDSLPSPHVLRRKILLKGKVEFLDEDEDEESYADEDAEGGGGGGKGKSKSKGKGKKGKKSKDSRKGQSMVMSPGTPVSSGGRQSPLAGGRQSPLGLSGGQSPCSESQELFASSAPPGRLRAGTRVARSGSVASLRSGGASSKFSPELSALTHLHGAKFPSLEDNDSRPCWEMCSYSEGAVAAIAKSKAALFVRHNQRFMSRVYPAGRRVDSSNYDPMPAWLVGAQMVALNLQTSGARMWLHRAFFSDNGDCGYRLKPLCMRRPEVGWHPALVTEHVLTLVVEVVSAWQLPKVAADASDIVDPYVVVDILGVPADRAPSQRTKTIKNNGFNPVWHHELSFNLTVPELAVLQLRVYDADIISKDDFIGFAGLPVESVRSGYRHIDLLDFEGNPIEGSSLLCRFRFL